MEKMLDMNMEELMPRKLILQKDQLSNGVASGIDDNELILNCNGDVTLEDLYFTKVY